MSKKIYIITTLLLTMLPICCLASEFNNKNSSNKIPTNTVNKHTGIIHSSTTAGIKISSITHKKYETIMQKNILPNIFFHKVILHNVITTNNNDTEKSNKLPCEIPATLFGAIIALYAAIIVLLSISMDKIDARAPEVQSFLCKKLKKLIRIGFLGIGSMLVTIFITSYFYLYNYEYVIQFIVAFINIGIALLYLAIKTIHYMNTDNIIKEFFTEDLESNSLNKIDSPVYKTLVFYIDKNEFSVVDKIMLSISNDLQNNKNNEKNKKNIRDFIAGLYRLLENESLLKKQNLHKFLKNYFQLISQYDFEFFKYNVENIIAYAGTWFNQNEKNYIKASSIIVEEIVYVIPRTLMCYANDKDDDKKQVFVKYIIETIFVYIIYIIRYSLVLPLQNIVVNFANIMNKNAPIKFEERYLQIVGLQLQGVMSIYLREYSKNDKTFQIGMNLRIFSMIVLEELIKNHSKEDAIIELIEVQKEIIECNKQEETYWISDLISLLSISHEEKVYNVFNKCIGYLEQIFISKNDNLRNRILFAISQKRLQDIEQINQVLEEYKLLDIVNKFAKIKE